MLRQSGKPADARGGAARAHPSREHGPLSADSGLLEFMKDLRSVKRLGAREALTFWSVVLVSLIALTLGLRYLERSIPDEIWVIRIDGFTVPLDWTVCVLLASIVGWVIHALLRMLSASAERAAALAESELYFRVMADNAPVLIWVADAAGGRVFFNRPWLEFTGRTREDHAGHGWLDSVHPDDRERCARETRQSREERRDYTIEYRLRRSDADWRWVLEHGAPRGDGPGQPAGYVGSCVDITDRRRAEEALAERESTLRSFLLTSPMMMGIVELIDDQDTLHISGNEAAAAMIGTTPENLAGRRGSEAGFPQPYRDLWVSKYIESRRRMAPVHFEFEYEHAGQGEQRWIAATVCPIGLGPNRRMRFSYVARDVSERRRYEQRLRESLAEQEKSLKREEALLRELDHRVRNNLAGLSGLVRVYERSGRPARDVCAALLLKLDAMRAVHDLISRQQGEPVQLSQLLGIVASELVGDGRSADVSASGPPIHIPARRVSPLVMILQELFTNCVKYGALAVPGGRVDITWRGGDDALELAWTESGGPDASRPRSRGVGLDLIQGFARAELAGDCTFSFPPTGFQCRLSIGAADRIADPETDPISDRHPCASSTPGIPHDLHRERPEPARSNARSD